MIEAGCNNLLFIKSEDAPATPANQRFVGFMDACEKAGVSVKVAQPNEIDYYSLSYVEWLESILKENPTADGIFAGSDVIAAQTLQVCRRLSIQVPEDLKIVGFDDVNIASLTTPQLTTIHQPIKEMANVAMDLLNDAADGKVVPKKTILPIKLVERETV